MEENKKVISDEDLEKVSGGHSDDNYGESYSGKESETIPAGTKLIYTEFIDYYKPHRCTYVRYAGGNEIVLKPDDDECKTFFETARKDDKSYVNKVVDGGTAYEVYYRWFTENHLYNA